MSSYPYQPQIRQSGPYNQQQLAQMQAQQQCQRQPSRSTQQPSYAASSYPSPDPSTSSDSTASSPEYYQQQPSPTLSRCDSSPYTTGPQQQQQRHPTPAPPAASRRPSSSQKDPNYFCLYPAHAGTAFQRKADLKRHYDQVHRPAAAARVLECPQPACHRRGEMGFGRKDKLVEHLREVHGLDIPKRAKGERRGEGR